MKPIPNLSMRTTNLRLRCEMTNRLKRRAQPPEAPSTPTTYKLEQSELELKKLQATSHIGSWVWDIQNNHVEWSDEMYRIFAVDPNTITGRLGDAITKTIHPDDLPIVQASNAMAFSERKPIEYRIIHPDQSIRYILAETGDVKFDATGKPAYLTGTAQDITRQKEIENALRASEARFRLAMEATSDGLWDWNIVTGEVYYSPTYWRMLGLAPDTAKTNHQIWIDLIHPLDRERTVALNLDCIENRCQEFEIEFRMKNSSGGWTWIMGRGKAVARAADGRALRLVGTHMDITQRKLAQEKLTETQAILQAAFDNSQAGIAIADAPGGKLRYVNQAGLLIPGKKPEELVTDVDLSQYATKWQILHFDGTLFEPDQVPLARAILYGEVCSKEFIIRRPDMEDRFVLANAAPVFAEDGTVKAGIVIFLDITERKKVEAQNQAQIEELRRWHAITMGREERILELKQEINHLLTETGQAPRYASVQMLNQRRPIHD